MGLVLVDGKVCGVACVGGDGDGARVGGVAVVPLQEMVAIEWGGEDDGGGVVIVGTGACDGTVCVVCADGSKSVCVDGKDGSECDVGCYIDKSGVVGVIVGPADEVVALVGDGTDLDGCVVVVDTGSVD